MLRRAPRGTRAENVVRAGNVEVDFNRRLVKKRGGIVSLSRTEWTLLQHLASNAGKILFNGELLGEVWGPEYAGDLQYLRVWVSRLRRKIEDNPAAPTLIRTFQGMGYMFDSGQAATAGREGEPERATAAAI